jgi:hypothetical protein
MFIPLARMLRFCDFVAGFVLIGLALGAREEGYSSHRRLC